MTKKELTDRLLDLNNGKIFMTRNKARSVLGIRGENFDRLMDGCPPATMRRGARGDRRYFIDDIVAQIMKKGM